MRVSGGIDIVEVHRIEEAIKRWGESFLKKIYTESEILEGSRRRNCGTYYASRFAAKEAVYKALAEEDQRKIYFTDIKISTSSEGRPVVSLRDSGGQFKLSAGISLSISHCHDYAVAWALSVDGREEALTG